MKIDYKGNKIIFKKELNALDDLAIDFTSVLNRLEISYVVVSGYVSILFGRSRSSEDIDILIEKISLKQFKELWVELYKNFESLTTEKADEAYKEYLSTKHAIRFSKKNKFVPNIEFKFPKMDIEYWALKERKEVILNDEKLFISPIELQISFKLYLGSEKDIEDAKYLYELFKNKLNLHLLEEFNRKFKIGEVFNQYLK